MGNQGRDGKGRFGNKSESGRKVRSLRASDEVWDKLGVMAETQGITRADLIEQFAINNGVIHGKNENRGIEILEEALKLKANAGGAIKKKIREYLEFYRN